MVGYILLEPMGLCAKMRSNGGCEHYHPDRFHFANLCRIELRAQMDLTNIFLFSSVNPLQPYKACLIGVSVQNRFNTTVTERHATGAKLRNNVLTIN